jgi:uncharacterized phage infection (PIP) family protein YhgE
MFHFDVTVRSVSDEDIHSIKDSLSNLMQQGVIVMATLAEVNASIAQVSTDVAAVAAQLAAGGTVTAADLDATVASLSSLDKQVKALIPAVVTPVV